MGYPALLLPIRRVQVLKYASGQYLEGEINVGSSPWKSTGVMMEPVFVEGMKGASPGKILGVAFPLACTSALAKARSVAKRCCGSLARAIAMTCSTSSGSVGSLSRKDGTGANTCWLAISVNVPWKG